jgi:hypothetical protein
MKKYILILIAIILIGGIIYVYNNKYMDKNNVITQEQYSDQGLNNQYQLSLYGNGKGKLNVYLDGQIIKEFSMSDPISRSLSSLLYIRKGENKLTIEIIPSETSEEMTYAYDIYEFPKDNTDQSLIFDDRYKLYSSKKNGEITGLVHTSEKTKFDFNIVAK